LVTHVEPQTFLSEEEVLSYLQKRVGLLDGIVVTGGEPLLQQGIESFLAKVKAMGYAVKLDTNGTFPHKLKSLVESGLVDYVAMDIKNSPDKYPLTAGCDTVDMSAIEESVRYLLSDVVDYEFRTTVTAQLHTPQDIVAIARWIQGAKRYFLQNFKDSGDLVGTGNTPVSPEILAEMRSKAQDIGLQVMVR
jgi:pyruvate formate lyase activating enzyme